MGLAVLDFLMRLEGGLPNVLDVQLVVVGGLRDHDALISIFYFIDTSISKTCGHIFRFRLSLDDKRGLSLGELIRPFCIMLLYQYFIALWAVITHYVTILMPFLSYFTRLA